MCEPAAAAAPVHTPGETKRLHVLAHHLGQHHRLPVSAARARKRPALRATTCDSCSGSGSSSEPGPAAASVEGRPIRSWIYGTEATHTTLILGGIHGNEPAGPTLCDAMRDFLDRNPGVVEGRRVVVAPALNPDGLAANTRENARGVDLNRNFDTINREASDRFGSSPLSEPESRFVAQLIAQFAPAVIVSVHQPLACVDYDGPAAALAAAVARECGLPVEKLVDSKPYPGSLGSHAGVDRGIPIVTLELPSSDVMISAWDKESLWDQYGGAMLEAVRMG